MTGEIGIGLVGYGGIGRLHAMCLRMLPLAYPELPSCRVIGVVTASTASAERARRELGDVVATTRLDEILSHPAVTLIDCCAPTGDHAHVVQAALIAGKAVFCEKPLAADAAEARALAQLARERGMRAGLNYHFRFVPAIQEARRRIEAGLLGEVLGAHLRYYRSSNVNPGRPATWRFTGSGSGVLTDLGAHLIDLALHLFGPIVAVAAHTRTLIPERPGPDGEMIAVDADDAAWLQVSLAGGGTGTIEASKLVPGAGDDLRFEAYGTRGALIFDTRNPNVLQITEGPDAKGWQQLTTASAIRPRATLPGAETPTGVLQWHLASLAAFLEALSGDAPYAPDFDAGLQVDEVLAAARRSAQQGGARIDL